MCARFIGLDFNILPLHLDTQSLAITRYAVSYQTAVHPETDFIIPATPGCVRALARRAPWQLSCLSHRKTHVYVTMPTFSALGLAETLLRALDQQGLVTPTPIQAEAIPPLLQGQDVLGIAQTGTGKTAAFALPMLHLLAAMPEIPAPKSARALVLAPTRELVLQISTAIRQFSKYMRLSQTSIVGGVPSGKQIRAMTGGVDILVATPGRLLDLINQGYVRLDSCTFLTLDEADRMLDMGFIHDVRRIVKIIGNTRQSLLFSATMPGDILRFAQEILHNPVRVEVTPQTVSVDRITQQVYYVSQKDKRALLTKILANKSLERVIVFSRTKHGADRITKQLGRAGIMAEAIHGNKSQGARQRALGSFRDGKARVLVATDIAARGIDVDKVTHVVNFDLPHEAESYVHRIGRTARAGAEGTAISFCDSEEFPLLQNIERLTRKPLELIGGTPPVAILKTPHSPGKRTRNNRRRAHGNDGQKRTGKSVQGRQSRQGGRGRQDRQTALS